MSDIKVKVTRIIYSRGSESLAEDIPLVGNQIRFPEATDNDWWAVYVPLQGSSDDHFYLWRHLAETAVQSELPNRMLTVSYLDADLMPQTAPHGPNHEVMFGDGDGSYPALEECGRSPVLNVAEWVDCNVTVHYDFEKNETYFTWTCNNHPPGLEIQMPLGEKCSACGRGNER